MEKDRIIALIGSILCFLVAFLSLYDLSRYTSGLPEKISIKVLTPILMVIVVLLVWKGGLIPKKKPEPTENESSETKSVEKGFFKLDRKKIIISIILLLLAVFSIYCKNVLELTFCKVYFYLYFFWSTPSVTEFFYTLNVKSPLLSIIITYGWIIIESYIIACLIVWIYNKVRKKN